MYAEVHSNDYYGTKYYKTCKNMGEHAIGENQNRCTNSEKNIEREKIILAHAHSLRYNYTSVSRWLFYKVIAAL